MTVSARRLLRAALCAMVGAVASGPALFAHSAFAKDDPPPAIDAERPGFTAGPTIVKRLQLETGLTTISRDSGVRSKRLLDGTLLRIPFQPKGYRMLEVRVGLPARFHNVEGSVDSGWSDGDSSIGAKWMALEERGTRPGVSLIGTVTIPTGGALARVGSRSAFSAALEAERHLTDRWTVQADVVVTRIDAAGVGGPDRNTRQTSGAVNFGYAFTPQISGFVEVYALSAALGARSRTFADGGVTYLIGSNTQLDLSGGLALNGSRRDGFLSAGVSRRW